MLNYAEILTIPILLVRGLFAYIELFIIESVPLISVIDLLCFDLDLLVPLIIISNSNISGKISAIEVYASTYNGLPSFVFIII